LSQLDSHKGQDAAAAGPFFIVYKARSGSTHLAELLTAHPSIGIAPESNLVLSLWEWSGGGRRRVETADDLREALDMLYAEPKFVTWEVGRGALEASLLPRLPVGVGEVAMAAVNDYCAAKYPSSSVRGVKKGSYALHAPAVLGMFPGAKFISLVRDGRAIYASSKRARHSDTGEPFETDPVRSALVWKRMVTALDRYRGEPFFLEIQYERLIAEPEETLRRVLSFLGLPAGPAELEAMLRPREAAFVHKRYSYLHPHVGKAGQLSRIDGWREELPEGEVREFERVAGQTLASKGYEPVSKPGAWDRLRASMLETRVAVGRRLRRKA